MKVPTLKTERLIIRPLELKDADWIQNKFNDWDIIKYMNKNVPWPYPENGAQDFLETVVLPDMKSGVSCNWAICKKENITEGIGVISFGEGRNREHGNRGFWIEKPEQKKGYVTEACYALNEYVFNELKWDKFTAENAIGNIASKRIKEKTGGVKIDEQEREFVSGKYKTEIWEITKENWNKIKTKS